MKIAILSANLGNFDTNTDNPVEQDLPVKELGIEIITFHRFTDFDFPPITGFTPRLQYRIPKLFGYEMFPEYDVYIWLDGGMNLERTDSLQWLLEQLGDNDMAFFRHPWRGTMREEVEHIEKKLEEGNEYIVSRYKNGLHREMLEIALTDPDFKDDTLYASTVFIYRNTEASQEALQMWWYYQSRYYTCDQVNLPYALAQSEAKVKKIPDNLFKIGYISLVSHHK